MFSWLVSPYKDVNSLPEIKLQDNEEIIFSNYKIKHLMRVIQLGIKTCVLLTIL